MAFGPGLLRLGCLTGSSRQAASQAGGNANDHRRSTRRMPLLEAIVNAHIGGQARHLDLIRFWVDSGGAGWSQYAHSYVGFWLTPFMAVGLKRDQKGTIAELASVLRTFTDLAPVEIVRSNDSHELYGSLIFANVDRMAKYGLISNSGRPDDGPFRNGVLSACTPVADRADGAPGIDDRPWTTATCRSRQVRPGRRCSGPDPRRDLPTRGRVEDHRFGAPGSIGIGIQGMLEGLVRPEDKSRLVRYVEALDVIVREIRATVFELPRRSVIALGRNFACWR